ncbi:MAG: Holliday junction resolvase RuvX [Mycoplasmataceae bacterium]|nr:Holliday junction resolvase RuvX [Mycoplasmataceae bacterium]
MRYLSLDLGIKSCGICVSDPTNIIPVPVENFMFPRGDFLTALYQVKFYVEKYKITTIILGYPIRTDGKKSQATIQVEEFKTLLENAFDKKIKIELIDETNSTKRGLELLARTKKSPENLKNKKDVMAAYIIMQDFLMNV